MSLIKQVLRYITGTTNPTKRRIIESIMVLLFMFILGFFGNVFLTKIFLEKADVFVSFSSLDKDEINYFFPVNLINSGQKDLTNLKLYLKTCYMDKPRLYGPFNRLVKTEKKSVKFRDRTTFNILQKKTCNPDINFSFTNCEIEVYKINETDLYVPPTNCSIYFCDFCNLTAIVSADQFPTPIKFYSRFFAPKEIRLKVTPKTILKINVSSLEKYSHVRINFVNEREICVWDGTCSVGELKQASLRYYLPRLPIEMTLNPKGNYKPINITIDYVNFSLSIKK